MGSTCPGFAGSAQLTSSELLLTSGVLMLMSGVLMLACISSAKAATDLCGKPATSAVVGRLPSALRSAPISAFALSTAGITAGIHSRNPLCTCGPAASTIRSTASACSLVESASL